MNLKNLWSSANIFFRENLILVIIVLGVGFCFFSESDAPVPIREEHAMMMDEAAESFMPRPTAVSKMAYGRGGGRDILPPVYAESFDPDQAERKIVKNASLTIEVENTEMAKELIEEKVKELKGAITHLNSWEVRPNVLSYSMTLRIPAELLDKSVDVLAGFGVKKAENFSTRDITAAYFDTENQLENLRARRDRLRKLMEMETKALKDILEVDRELSNVQRQIENLERTQKRRDTDVSYSTLSLTIQPEPEIGDFKTPEWTPEKSWKQSVNDLIYASQNIFDKIMKLIVFTPIWLPILLIAIWIRWKFFRKKK